MKITSIKQQVAKKDRYSIYVDDSYSFSLSEGALLESKIYNGQELNIEQIGEFKKLSADDKIYASALRFAAMRAKTRWEVEFYLQRKDASPALSECILNMLSNLKIIDDFEYAKTFIRDRNLLRPSSKRKIQMDLRKKRIDSKTIDRAMDEEANKDDSSALQAMIAKKRRQSKYQDDTKLMQYLARQGFGYDDIKTAIRNEAEQL